MIPWAELALWALAAWAAVEAWESALFAHPRAYLEVWRDEFTGWRHWIGELLLCPFCLLYHAVWICAVLDAVGGRPILLWLAAVRLATAGLKLGQWSSNELSDLPVSPGLPGSQDEPGNQRQDPSTGELPRLTPRHELGSPGQPHDLAGS